jgi:hypothetical protein
MLLHYPLGARGDSVEHEGRHRGVLQVGGLTDEGILHWGYAHL